MTIEELVAEIQNGHTEYLPELWDKVYRFVAKKANNFLTFLGDNPPCEFDDLCNNAYIYLLYALKQFDPEEGFKFLTYYGLALKNAFREAAGLRTVRARNDPLRNAISFSAPIADAEDSVIEDIIADDVDVEEEVAKQIYDEELHNALEDALGKIDAKEEKAIRMKYYSGLNLEQIGNELGVTPQRAEQLCKKGLRDLRHPEIVKNLEQFVDLRTNFYLGVSAHSQQSPVELLVIERENMRNRASRFNGVLL
jgi:RNA polymerase sporulation-specific sigma factor